MAVNAVLMVSNLPQPKLALSKSRPVLAFQLVVVLSVFVLIPLHRFPTYLIAVAATYTVGGFIYGLAVARHADDEDDADEDELAHGHGLR